MSAAAGTAGAAATGPNVKVGQRVSVIGKNLVGTVRFVGVTKFATGKWVGIELDEPLGKNNGTVQEESYFTCPDLCGMFVRQNQVELVKGQSDSPAKPASTKAATSSSTKAPAATSTATAASTTAKSASAAATGKTATAAAHAAPSAAATGKTATAAAHAAPSAAAAAAAAAAAPAPAPAPAPVPSIVLPAVQDLPEMVVSKTDYSSVKNDDLVRELEKTKAQLQQMIDFKAIWLKAQSEMKAQLDQAQSEARFFKDKMETEVALLSDTAEMATMDKELAEEHVRDLEERLAILTEQNNQNKLQLEMYRSQGTVPAGVTSQVSDIPAYKELESQNARLKEGLVRLKEHCDLQAAELELAREELREAQGEAMATNKNLQAKTEQLEKALKQINSYKENADAASGAEAMIERLTDKNLKLEERNRRLDEELTDLEALLAMNEQLEEAHVQTEKELRMELDAYVSRTYDYARAIEALGKKNQELSALIQQYKERLRELEGEASDLKQKELELEEGNKENQSKAVLALNMQLSSAVNRERAKNVEVQLHKLESEQAARHIELLKMFVSESFIATDYDGLRLLLLLDRFMSKTAIVSNYAQDQFHLTEDMKTVLERPDMTLEQWCFGNSLLYYLAAFKSSTEVINKALECGDVSLFHALGGLYPEIAKHETALDTLVQRVKGDGLDPQLSLDGMRAAVDHMERVISAYVLAKSPPSDAEELKTSMSLISCAATANEALLGHLEHICKTCGPDGSFDQSFADLCSRVGNLTEQSRQIKQLSRKITRRMPDGKDLTIKMSDAVRADLRAFTSSFRDINTGLFLTTKAYFSHIHGTVTLKTLPYETALQLAVNNKIDFSVDGDAAAKARAEGADASLTPLHLEQLYPMVAQQMQDFSEALSRGDFDVNAVEPERHETAWQKLALETRKALADTLGLGDQLEKKQQELKEVKTLVKVKEKELNEQIVLAEASGKRVEALRADLGRQIKDLEAKLKQAQDEVAAKTKELKDTIESAREDILAAEAERDELKKKMDAGGVINRRGFRAVGGSAEGGGGDASMADLRAALMQVDTLQQALYQVRAELSRSRAENMRQELLQLPALHISNKPVADENADHAKVESITDKLLSELNTMTSAPRVIDISGRRGAKPLAPPKAQLEAQVNALASVRRKSIKLKTRIDSMLATEVPGAKAVSGFSSFLSPMYTRVVEESKTLPRLGQIQLPAGVGTADALFKSRVPLTLTGPAFQQIHEIFAS